MKPVKEVEADRKRYYNQKNINTVHRSSLLIPKIKGLETTITFLNHWYLKRNYNDIALKLSCYDKSGKSGDAVTYKINEPKVYIFKLEKIFGEDFQSYQAEFFTSNNFFIPYAAVMVNHEGSKCINTVHAYNRTLNDCREEEKISMFDVNEASIDFVTNNRLNTFLILHSGNSEIKNQSLNFEIFKNSRLNKPIESSMDISMPKMTAKKINISEIFKNDLPKQFCADDYILTIKQPKQKMFYGRILTGIQDKKSNSFSGNHSYYDNSNIKEYFEKNFSYKTSPYFDDLKNKVRFYPIQSPGKGVIDVYLNYISNKEIKSYLAGTYKMDNNKTLVSIDINELVKKSSIEEVKTFTLIYKTDSEEKTPSRLNYQLIYGSKNECGVNASINVSLYNDDLFLPKDKKSIIWGQLINDEKYNNFLGICFIDNIDANKKIENELTIETYDQDGLIKTEKKSLKALDSFILKNQYYENRGKYIWYLIKCNKPQLHMYHINLNKNSEFSSGEHNF